jgi:hypothetical protein
MTKTQGKRTSKRVAIYLRVSTTEQTTTNQRRELHAVAERHSWSVVQVFEDAGISGAKGRKDRPAPQGRYGFRPFFSLRDLLRVGHGKYLLPQNETEQWGFQSARGSSRKLAAAGGVGPPRGGG